jgi:Ca-activated chloride channel homolog
MTNVLNVSITPHREYLPADADLQRLFVMLKMRPAKEIIKAKPTTAFAIVVDTSGSMDDRVLSGKTKREIVITSLLGLIKSGNATAKDHISLIQFDETASIIIGLTSATETQKLEHAINQLRGFSGGTNMEKGLRLALQTLADRPMTNRRVLLFTDGQTFDEDQCLELVNEFAASNIPITALGVGSDFNEDLLNRLSDAAGGRTFHIVTDNASGAQVAIADLPAKVAEELSLAQDEVITNLMLSAKMVQGVELSRIMRAYPSFTEFSIERLPCAIGNASASDETTFILEFNIGSRPASRIRIAQIGITYNVPGENRKGELPPQDLVVQFMAGDSFAVQVDPDVMHYVQQCNLDKIVKEATLVAEADPQKAEQLLENARRMSQRVGNLAMDHSLSSAQDELRKTRQISSSTRKTIKMGSKGKTVKMDGGIDELLLSEEEIQKASGT